MNTFHKFVSVFLLWLSAIASVRADRLPHEFVTTTPVFADGVLYVASSEYPLRRGHLRAIDISDTFPLELWDAAEKVPVAGSNPVQPDDVWEGNHRRFLITNAAGELFPLAADQAQILCGPMNATASEEAALILHMARGRRGGTLANPAGNREAPYRLWGISRSSPVMVGRSVANPAARQRDQVIYVGAEDGMLHAFLVRGWDERPGSSLMVDRDGGAELWAYLPGSFLPYLHDQLMERSSEELIIHLDGSPIVKELFVDLNEDGRRSWHTLLIGTGTISQSRQSSLFVLDVTDPYHPAMLWEGLLPGEGTGRTRGVTVDQCADSDSECLYLAADYNDTGSSAGLHVLALDLLTKELLWQFSTTYAARGGFYEATPGLPSLMDLDQDSQMDTLIVGDLAGQLWALRLADGHAYGGAPAFVVPDNLAEPIGASVVVYGNTVVFGTGGIAGSNDQQQYALYKVKVSSEGGELLWRFPLAVGMKIWAPPLLDAQGNVIFTASTDYDFLLDNLEEPAGSILVLNKDGAQVSKHEAGDAILGRVVSSEGLVITVSVTGQVKQFGTAGRLTGPGENRGSVRILSWRQR